MVAHSIVVALLAAAPAASPEQSSAQGQPAASRTDSHERMPQQLRDAVHEAMRRQATAKGAEQAAAVQKLAAVYRELTTSTQLPSREQRELRALVRSRLARTSQTLERELAKAEAADRKHPAPPGDRGAGRDRAAAGALLAQVQGIPGAPQPNPQAGPNNRQAFGPGAQFAPRGQALAGMTAQNAQQLIDLIQTTIAPASWDINGGLGTIVYFEPKQVLVIRQTGDVHDQVGAAIGGLRRN